MKGHSVYLNGVARNFSNTPLMILKELEKSNDFQFSGSVFIIAVMLVSIQFSAEGAEKFYKLLFRGNFQLDIFRDDNISVSLSIQIIPCIQKMFIIKPQKLVLRYIQLLSREIREH